MGFVSCMFQISFGGLGKGLPTARVGWVRNSEFGIFQSGPT